MFSTCWPPVALLFDFPSGHVCLRMHVEASKALFRWTGWTKTFLKPGTSNYESTWIHRVCPTCPNLPVTVSKLMIIILEKGLQPI